MASSNVLKKLVLTPGSPVTPDKSLPLTYRQKIRIPDLSSIHGHHRGGWKYVIGEILGQLSVEDGIPCIPDVGDIVADEKVKKLAQSGPWIGFAHQTPKANYPEFPDLERMVKHEAFLTALQNCRGLYTLCTVVKKYLKKHLPANIPVCLVYYPCTPFEEKYLFDMTRYRENKEKKVLFIGEFMRKFQAIYDLQVPAHLKKILIKARDVDLDELYDVDCQRYELQRNDSVELWNEQVSDEEYDKLLSENVVFLNLFDAGACTLLTECAARGTPLVINRLLALEEYLGEDYPLFYKDMEEAAKILSDDERLERGSIYLRGYQDLQMKLSGETFARAFVNSAIYRGLPLPRSRSSPKLDPPQTKFPCFDLSIVMYVDDKIDGVSHHLESIAECDDGTCIQVIVWHHREVRSEVKGWTKRFNNQLYIDLIESSVSYMPDAIYNAVKELMYSKTLLVLDSSSFPEQKQLQQLAKENANRGRKAVFVLDGGEIKEYPKSAPAERINPFDVSLVMCQYKRVDELDFILRSLDNQSYEGKFQLIIWNNNHETQQEVEEICQPFEEQLNIELVQSTRNYYCAIRFAVKDLMKSDLMLIIDDDIKPTSGYIQRFVDGYNKYGPRATICCRGHIFPWHPLDEEKPEKEWESEQHDHATTKPIMVLCDQSMEDCQIHFIHADNLLIPRLLLEEALAQHELPQQEFIIVDDYWLSFVLSHHMGIPLWRVKADDVMEMSESGDDPNKALYRNVLTREHRVDFYIYHHRHGWPNNKPLPLPINHGAHN